VNKNSLPEELYNILAEHASGKKFYVAFSGGLDSHVLLHALATCKKTHPQLQLTAIHINHSLSKHAKKWAKHCSQVAKKLNVKFIDKTVNAKILIPDHSPEEIARHLRYEALAKCLPKNACLLTAHHLDDQVETLLLQMFRGAGPKGLAAMPLKKIFAKGFLLRPLLNFTREQLHHYAKENHLKWIEDESNLDVKYERNYLRHKVLPCIKKHWPGVTASLQRVALHCSDAVELLEVLAEQDLTQIAGTINATVSAKKILQLDPVRQRNVLRCWLRQQQLTTPSCIKLDEILKNVISSRYDAVPKVTWHGGEVRRYRDNVYAMLPLEPFDNTRIISWSGKKPLYIKELGIALSTAIAKDHQGKLTVRFRHLGMSTLKNTFQRLNIPPWLRDRTPLIFVNNQLAAIITDYDTKIPKNSSR
jgi:tRNA(Ile)-lysidine synthase